MEVASSIEVLICGAGPAGLLVALGLAQQRVDTLIIERKDRAEQTTLGRATTIFARSLELLEQLNVLDALTQEGSISRSALSYSNGDRSKANVFQESYNIVQTSYNDYVLNIRQKHSEDAFKAKYAADFDKDVFYGWELLEYQLEKREDDDRNITAYLRHFSGENKIVRCKYLIGADGASSKVRECAGIAMHGDETTYKWARIDGKVKTDMPDSDIGVITNQSKTHGNVLWLKLDQDANRVGFVLSPALQEKYKDGMTEEQAAEEAVNAMKPFKLEVERVDWFTQYNIKQKVATTLQKDEFVLLVGDSAHTHSSGFAQGMNAAIHDATNLTWKLAGILKGWYSPNRVLPTYSAERRNAALKIIEVDRAVAAIISGTIPPRYGGPGTAPDDALAHVWRENMAFNVGLGVTYDATPIVREPLRGAVPKGSRAPDALVRHPGARVARRLHTGVLQASGLGRWTILVFAGHHALTKNMVVAIRNELYREGGLVETRGDMLNLATFIVGVVSGNPWDAFGGPAVGRLFFDPEADAHHRYGVSLNSGAIAVVRPDGILGFATGMDELDEVKAYFDTFCA